jgi:hypothetical protein
MSRLERLSTGQVASVERPTLAFPLPEATSQGIDRMRETSNVFDDEHASPRKGRRDLNTALETYTRARDPPKECEPIDLNALGAPANRSEPKHETVYTSGIDQAKGGL